MADLNAQIEAGLAPERDGKEQEAIKYFRHLTERYPRDARAGHVRTDELEQLLD